VHPRTCCSIFNTVEEMHGFRVLKSGEYCGGCRSHTAMYPTSGLDIWSMKRHGMESPSVSRQHSCSYLLLAAVVISDLHGFDGNGDVLIFIRS
jgi:hypothetical protein